MERIKIKSYQIVSGGYRKDNEKINGLLEIFIQKFGQLQDLVVREIEGRKYEVLKGSKVLRALKYLNEEIWCINLGKISDYDATVIRICLNELRFETDNIKKGEEISKIVKTKHDAKLLSSKIDMDIVDILRFTKLVDVDWKKELKAAEELEKNINHTLF